MSSRRLSDTPDTSRSVPSSLPSAVKVAGSASGTSTKKSTRQHAVRRTPQALIASTATPAVSADERRGMIARSAYLRAERRAFAAGGETEDWLAAEREVDALLGGGHSAAQ